MVGEAAGREPAAPVLGGRVDAVERLLRRLGRLRLGTPGERAEPALPVDHAMSCLEPLVLDREVQVAGEEQVRGIAIAAGDRRVTVVGERPGDGAAAVVGSREAEEVHVDLALEAFRDPDQHPFGIEVRGRARVRVVGAVAPRPDRERVVHQQPSGRRRPGRLENVGPGYVAARHRHRLARTEPEAAGAAVEQRAEDARGVEAGHAEPLDRALGSDQGGRVAIGEHRVVGDARKRRGVERRGIDHGRDSNLCLR